MALSKSESDIILNRANVALSRSQRLVSSWLPTEPETTSNKTEEELRREEDEIFTAVPETLGIGAPLPEKAADGTWNRKELGTNDLLRKQLLGRNYDRIMKEKAAQKQTGLQNTGQGSGLEQGQGQRQSSGQVGVSSTAAVEEAKEEEEDDDDDEEGRSAMIGKKRKKIEGVGENDGSNGVGGKGKGKGKKKAASYLDEILAQRASKKKKR
ncbi:hypothetical protein PENSTE_c010G08594 [Penicillium steckii]|uniref:Uncharacterized protein n=1 Tax=Penicillium steckii TaxID=303698 RepID=A0A1V6T954_9EURO|nr:hypothetical protein PENSTE_c010G08594 [Penicillium steckii]